MNERDRGNGSKNENPFYGQIPNLIEQSLKGLADKARRSRRQLIDGVIKDPYYDSAFITFTAISQLMAGEKNPTVVRNSIFFLSDLLQVVGTSLGQMEAKDLRVNHQTVTAADMVLANDPLVQKNKYVRDLIQQVIPKGYNNMLQCANLLKSTPAGVNIEIRAASPGRSDQDKVKQQQELQRLADWYNSFTAVLGNRVADGALNPQARDSFVDIFKAEPALRVYLREQLMKRRFAGLAIEDIEKTSYPPSSQTLDEITSYLAGVYSSLMSSRDHSVIENLFFRPIFFRSEPYGAVHYRNFNLLANINLWQERFIQTLIQNQDPQKEKQMKIILHGMSESATGLMLYDALQFSAYPLEHDPLFKGDNAEERYAQHPLLNQAITEFRQANPDTTSFYSDEVGIKYFQTTVFPQLQHRLDYFGVSSKFKDVATAIRTELKQRPFSEIHFDTLNQYFTEHCGQEFLSRLNRHSGDIQSITKSVWQSTLERVHYLPMQQGFNLIEFSTGSIPNILSIESVLLNTSGPLQEWEENVVFKLHGTTIMINGKLDQEGKLKLKAPLENRIPGLYTLLNHIAVLAFHDLVIQDRQEREKAAKGQHGIPPENQKPRPNLPKGKSYGQTLPRRQTDAQLIADVYKETKQTPRRVELHKRRLPGNDDYLESISSFEEAKRKYGEASSELVVAVSELSAARKQAKKASETKVSNLPARFRLGSIQDPITMEVRYFETWVVEHTSPKPTEEELKSPQKLFERYYKRSSALASLDQLKSWIVGE